MQRGETTGHASMSPFGAAPRTGLRMVAGLVLDVRRLPIGFVEYPLNLLFPGSRPLSKDVVVLVLVLGLLGVLVLSHDGLVPANGSHLTARDSHPPPDRTARGETGFEVIGAGQVSLL